MFEDKNKEFQKIIDDEEFQVYKKQCEKASDFVFKVCTEFKYDYNDIAFLLTDH